MKDKLNMNRGKIGKRFPVSPALFIGIESALLTMILEILSRQSFASAFRFLVGRPDIYLLNALMVSVTLAFAMLFRKKVFSTVLVTVIWLAFGIANSIVLIFRSATPLTAVDLQLGVEMLAIIDVYLRPWQIVLCVVGIIALIAALIVIAIRSPKYRKEGKTGLARFCAYAVALVLLGAVLLTSANGVSRQLRPSLYDSYLNYGFPYCFTFSFFDIGIAQPERYSVNEIDKIVKETEINVVISTESEAQKANSDSYGTDAIESARTGSYDSTLVSYTIEAVEAIKSRMTEMDDNAKEKLPNIIFVQLESFFDPMMLKNLTFSEDPVPNFRRLKEEYTSGKLFVPTVAGGTANTEFEVLTGYCLDFFGAGEFPYYSILKEEACESLAIDLRALDYTATAIHNYSGSFYYRNLVYDNLGFDRFVSKEYMDGYELTPMGWPKDAILQSLIREAMDSTEGKDFIYTVTVQNHGKYIEIPDEIEKVIDVEGYENESDNRVMEYFLTLIHDVDRLIGNLVEEYANYDEDVMIVFFGDHLPGLGITNEMLTSGDIYATEYVIWTNYGLEKRDMDLEAYQLGAYALMQNDIDTGTMIRYHQTQMGKPNYRDNLEILEYDMLYGERYVYQGLSLTEDNELVMGLRPIVITGAEYKNGNLFVKGENFTAASVAFLNGDKCDNTIFVDQSMLIIPNAEPKDGTEIVVVQISTEGFKLSSTQPFVCEGLIPINYRK